MTDAPDLLPCPFCAVYPSYEVAAFSTRHRIACEDCEFVMQKPTREEAQRAWNTRAALSAMQPSPAEAAKVLLMVENIEDLEERCTFYRLSAPHVFGLLRAISEDSQ